MFCFLELGYLKSCEFDSDLSCVIAAWLELIACFSFIDRCL